MTFLEKAEQAISESGGRMTAQRRVIVEKLADLNTQIDADTLLEQVQGQDEAISRATVYRTLNVLADAGLLQRRYLSPEHERQYFEPITTHEPSDYVLTCRRCHQTMPFQSKLLEQLQAELAAHYGYRDVRVCICADGVCSTCQPA